MNWNPNPPPVGGITVASLAEWLYRTLRDLAGVLQSVHHYEVLHTAPDKPKIGDVYYADGSDWNPGSGEGLYVYTAAGYVSGSTATFDVNAFSPLFFVDVPNQRVGILTATPSEDFEVAGNINLTGVLTVNSAAGIAGQILTSGGAGVAPTWTDSAGTDNLGNHIATQNIVLGSYYLSGDGDDEGILVNSAGGVVLSSNLDVNGYLSFTGELTPDASPGTAGQILTSGGGGVSPTWESLTETDPVFTASQAANVTTQMITDLGNLSGTNTGDQDLSSYQLKPAEGAFANGDKTKLDGIEAGADVTDTTNVTTAGAVMDSEVANLAQVKAFDSSDYATAAQGALADSAIQTETDPVVGAVNGIVKANGAGAISAASAGTDYLAPTGDGSGLSGVVTTETDPVFTASQAANITAQMITDLGNLSGTNTGDQDLSSYQLKPSEGAFVDGDKTKLDGIETGATADQSDAEIETAINNQLTGTVVGTSDTQTLTGKTIDGDNNTLSNLDIGNEVDWAVITDVSDASAFASGDKVLIFEAGVGLRKIDYDDLPAGGGGGGLSDVVDDTTPQLGGNLDLNGHKLVYTSTQLLYYPPTFIGSLFVGTGGGSLSHTGGSYGYYNTGIGIDALKSNTTGYYNTAIGYQALKNNTTGFLNLANGASALSKNISGNYNIANGYGVLSNNTTGDGNIANGVLTLGYNTTGSFNLGAGYSAGRYTSDGSANATGSYNFFLGAYTRALADGDTNELVLGYNAIGAGSNSVTLGNTSVTKTVIRGAIIGTERSSDPADPAEGTYALWQSNGTGSGDDGDILIKITAGGTTKTATLVDFSTL